MSKKLGVPGKNQSSISAFFGGASKSNGSAAASNGNVKPVVPVASATTTTTAASAATTTKATATTTPVATPLAAAAASASASTSSAPEPVLPRKRPKKKAGVLSSSEEEEEEAAAAAAAATTTTTTTATTTTDAPMRAKHESDDEMAEEDDEEDDDDEEEDGAAAAAAAASSSLKPAKKKAKKATTTATAATLATSAEAAKYDVVADAGWCAGADVPYAALAAVLARIEAVSGRLRIVEILADFFRSVIALSPDALLPCVYLASNKLAPAFEGLELGVGESLLMKAIAGATGRKAATLKAMYDEEGDLGIVAEQARATQQTMFPPPPLTVAKVYRKLRELATTSGDKSQQRKAGIVQTLLVAANGAETRYVVRAAQGKLRIGLAEKSVLAALARAITLTPPTQQPAVSDARTAPGATPAAVEAALAKANETLRAVYSELPSLDAIVPHLLRRPIAELPTHCYLTPGVPVSPMLAQPTKGVGEVLDRFSGATFTCEYKYDGERAQIHHFEQRTHIYSRNAENHTTKYPDIIRDLPRAVAGDVRSYILDSEAVAFDRETGKILPFQVLSTRSRKNVESADDVKVKVNGESLLRRTFAERRRLLHASFRAVEGVFAFAMYRDLSDTEEIQTFLNDAVAGNCEGLMVKTLEKDATYEPSRRSFNWLKLKKDYLEGMGDSCDLVPIGAWTGKGKRTGAYGAFLLACYDDENEVYQTVCKIGTGFSDDALKEHTTKLNEHVSEAGAKQYYSVADTMRPDVWFEPAVVWEVKAADLSVSPVHTAAAGQVDATKGIALRFPRFVRARDDKTPEQATTAEQIADMYRAQNLNTATASSSTKSELY